MLTKRPLQALSPRALILSVLVLLTAVLAADAFWWEPSSLRLVERPIELKRADAKALDGLRIVVIGDIHGGAPFIDEAKIRDVVDLANSAKPDLILLAGDYVARGMIGSRPFPIERIATLLQKLRARFGVYAVLGNHDHWENAARISREIAKQGIPVLENRSVAIRNGDQIIYLAGIGDRFSDADDQRLALDHIPAEQGALCFTHSPDVFPDLPAACALTVAAHTHGGQVWLPLLGRLIVPSRFGQRYAAGIIREGTKTLFVSTGVGTSIIPVRFLVPPEVSILDIHVRKSG